MVTRQNPPTLPSLGRVGSLISNWFVHNFLSKQNIFPLLPVNWCIALFFFSKIVYGGFGKKPCEVEIESYEHYAFGNSNDLRISRMLKVNVSRYKSQLFIIHHLINCFQTGLQWKNAFLRDRLLTGKCSSIHFFSLIFKIMFFIFMSQERCG